MKVTTFIIIGLFLSTCIFAQQELPPETITATTENNSNNPSLATLYKDLDSLEVSNLLEKTSGLHVNRSGGFGQFSTVNIRGTSPGHTQLLWDGIPTYSDRQNTVNLSLIQASLIDSIDIYKGYIPLKFNSSPIGGLIEFKSNTFEPENGFRSLFSTSVGSYDYNQNYLAIEDVGGGHKNNFGILLEQGKNNYPFLNDRGTPFNSSDDSVDQKQNNGFQQLTMQIKLQKEFSNQKIIFALRPTIGYNEIGGPQGVQINSAQNTYDRTDSYLNYIIKLDRFEVETFLFTQFNRNLLDDRLGEIGFTADVIKNKSLTNGFRNILHHDFTESIAFNFLNAFQQTAFDEINILKKGENNWQQTQYDGGAEIVSKGQKLSYSLQSKWTYLASDTQNKEHFEKDWSHQAMIQYHVNDHFDTMFSIVNSHRYPTLSELFGSSGLIIGNQSLVPETALSFSLDSKGTYSSRNFNLTYGASLFLKSIDDLIHFEIISAGLARPTNAEKAEIMGLEFSLNIGLTKFYSLNMHYTNQRSINKSSGIYHNKIIPGQPESSLYINNAFTWNIFYLDFSLQSIQNEYLDQANIGKIDEKFLMNIGCGFKKKNLSFRAEIQNIADKQYEDFFNYPLPGRYFLVQSQINF